MQNAKAGLGAAFFFFFFFLKKKLIILLWYGAVGAAQGRGATWLPPEGTLWRALTANRPNPSRQQRVEIRNPNRKLGNPWAEKTRTRWKTATV